MNHRLVSVCLASPLARASARATLLAALLLAPAACKKKEIVQPVPPGLLDDNGRQIVAPPSKPPEPSETAPQPEAPTVYDFEKTQPIDPGALSGKLAPSGLSPGDALGASASEDAGAPARDLSGELSAALSPLSSCVDAARAATLPDGRLTIAVSASLQSTGRVSRATVTAPGQPASALACMEKQVLALSLRGPIPDAPTQVTGSTQLQIRAAAVPAAGQLPAQNANPVVPQPTSTDLARPDPGETAGPP